MLYFDIMRNSVQAFVVRDATIPGKYNLLIFFRQLHSYQRKLVLILATTYTGTDSSKYGAYSSSFVLLHPFRYLPVCY
jgi:hypothetical protein